ncbi:MAG TPA: ABC transporter permease, partial [Chitinophagaceae bacterium]|nr:ABC transporter permease [Chitinophagaceae bacterium]
QFLGESFVLCLIAFVLAIGLVELTLPVFNKLSSKALSLSYLMDAKLVAGYILLLLLTGLLAGFYPALVLSGYNPVKTLYNRFNLAGKNYLQKSLVVLQFALASFLIAGTFTIFSQFTYLTSRPLGYDDSNLAITNVWGIDRNQAKLMRDELLRHSSIASVARKNSGDWGTVARVNGEQQLSFAYETIDETYIPQLKMQLVAGRNFSPDLVSDTAQSVLVNEAFVKEAGWQNPLGQEVNFWYNNNKKYTVIGVVKDYHFESLNTKIRPQLFTMNPGNAYGQFLIKIKEGHTTAALAHLGKTFRSLFPVKPFSYQFMDQQNLLRYEAEKKWSQILLFSAALTIFISCIGLFGLAVLAAEKRTKEIGIRKVLGASVPGIAASLSKDFIKLVLLSLVISIPCAWLAGSKWLDNYPYRVALSWTLFIQTSVLVIIIALLTIGYQSVKAALANPVKALRTE